MPTHRCKLLLLLLVPLFVPSDLRHPELRVCLRNLAALRTLNVRRNVVSVPKATIDEDASPVFLEHQVGMSWQSFMIEPISEASLPQSTPHNHLRLRVLRTNRSHRFVPLLWSESVGHIIFSVLTQSYKIFPHNQKAQG